MRGIRKITPEKVKAIKIHLSEGLSLRQTAHKVKVSYKTCWLVKENIYDDRNRPLIIKQESDFFEHGKNWI